MSVNPRSYRVPVLRLTDVYQGDSINGDPGSNDVLEPTSAPQGPAQSTGQQPVFNDSAVLEPTPVLPQHSALKDYVPEEPLLPTQSNQDKDEYVGEPIPDLSGITYTPTSSAQKGPVSPTKVTPSEPSSPLMPDMTKEKPPMSPPVKNVGPTVSPWTINPSLERPELATMPVEELPPPPPPQPPKPAVAPLKKPDEPFKKTAAPDIPDMWEVAASRPVPQPTKSVGIKNTPPVMPVHAVPVQSPRVPESTTQNLINKALTGMGFGEIATPQEKPEPAQEVPPVAEAGNLANLRARVEGAHAHESTQPAPVPRPAVEPSTPTTETRHVVKTEHAKVLADVARNLHTIHDSTELLPDMRDTQTTQAPPENVPFVPSPVRHADFLEEDLVVTPAQKEGPSRPISMIRTFKADVENAITHNKVSMVNMIAAEEKRRYEPQENKEVRRTKKRNLSVRTYMLVLGSLGLLAITVALGFFIANLILNSEKKDTTSEIFFSDAGREFDITGKDRTAIMKGMTDLRDTIDLAVGEIVEIRVSEKVKLADGQTEQSMPVTASAFLTRLQTRAPDFLQRTLHDSFIFGIHRDTAGKRHPFFVFKVRTYGIAFPGMLEWEEGLDVDLAPLFGLPIDRALIERLANEATTVGGGTSAVPTNIDLNQVGLYDDVDVANQAMRALRDLDGEIQLLWTITPGDNLLIITTNAETFRQIGKRL
jgi:hypothetical protein